MKVLRTALTHKVLRGNTQRTRADCDCGRERFTRTMALWRKCQSAEYSATRIRSLEHCSTNRRPPHKQTWPTLQMLETRVRNEVEVAARE